MNMLAMMQAVAKNAGIEVPISLDTDEPNHVLMVEFLNEAGAEVARRVDWGATRQTAALTGTGAAANYPLPDQFDRLSPGLSVVSNASPVRGSLTADEWLSLTPVAGEPRYFYLAAGRIAFYPFLRTAATATVQFQSSYWALSDVGPQEAMVIAEDRALVPSDLLVSGAVWRWRRHVGKDFADYVAEFEAMLSDRARFDGGVRQP